MHVEVANHILPCGQDQHKGNPLEMVTVSANIKMESKYQFWCEEHIFIPLLIQTGNFALKVFEFHIYTDAYSMPYQDKNGHYTAILALI